MRALILSVVALSAHAAELAVYVDLPGGVRIELYSEVGICQHGARTAAWISTGKRVDGCWTDAGSSVSIAYLDGESGALPKSVFRPLQRQ